MALFSQEYNEAFSRGFDCGKVEGAEEERAKVVAHLQRLGKDQQISASERGWLLCAADDIRDGRHDK